MRNHKRCSAGTALASVATTVVIESFWSLPKCWLICSSSQMSTVCGMLASASNAVHQRHGSMHLHTLCQMRISAAVLPSMLQGCVSFAPSDKCRPLRCQRHCSSHHHHCHCVMTLSSLLLPVTHCFFKLLIDADCCLAWAFHTRVCHTDGLPHALITSFLSWLWETHSFLSITCHWSTSPCFVMQFFDTQTALEWSSTPSPPCLLCCQPACFFSRSVSTHPNWSSFVCAHLVSRCSQNWFLAACILFLLLPRHTGNIRTQLVFVCTPVKLKLIFLFVHRHRPEILFCLFGTHPLFIPWCMTDLHHGFLFSQDNSDGSGSSVC